MPSLTCNDVSTSELRGFGQTGVGILGRPAGSQDLPPEHHGKTSKAGIDSKCDTADDRFF